MVDLHGDLLDGFGEAGADFVLYDHADHQLVQRLGRVLVINPGSAGDPRDNGNGRQFSCAVLDTVTEWCPISRIDYCDPGNLKCLVQDA